MRRFLWGRFIALARRVLGGFPVARPEQARLGLQDLGAILESEGQQEQLQALVAQGLQDLLEIQGQEVIQDQ